MTQKNRDEHSLHMRVANALTYFYPGYRFLVIALVVGGCGFYGLWAAVLLGLGPFIANYAMWIGSSIGVIIFWPSVKTSYVLDVQAKVSRLEEKVAELEESISDSVDVIIEDVEDQND